MKRIQCVIGGFLVCQVVILLLSANGAFTDEGIYILAGRSLILGTEDQADYALWLDGSPYLFPLLSGLAHLAGGLAASRLCCVAQSALGLWFFACFVNRCFGRAVAGWATLLLAANGAFFSLAHLAVYDSLAFAALAACLWSARELARSPRIEHVVRAALAASLAVTSKYSIAVLLIAGSPLLLLSSRRPPWLAAGLVATLAVLVAITYMYVAHGEIIPALTLEILMTHPVFADRSQLGFQLLCLLALPLGLSIVGAWRIRGSQAPLACQLLAAGLLWPALHLLRGESVSASKHVALSCVFLCPLAGVALAHWWQERPRLAGAIVAGAVSLGALQAFVIDHSWPDLRPLTAIFLPQLEPFDTVGIYTGWDLAMYAVATGHLSSPAFVMGEWRLRQKEDPCSNVWLIGLEPAAPSSEATAAQPPMAVDPFSSAAQRCGYERFASFPASTYALAWPLFRHAQQQFIIYRRLGSAPVRLRS